MSILHISTHDAVGGAAIAAFRLHQGLRRIGVDSSMLVNHRVSNDRHVYSIHKRVNRMKSLQIQFASYMDKQPLYRRRIFPRNNWSLNWFPSPVVEPIYSLHPDLIHLHWIGDGFIPIRALKQLNVPIVWTLHDMWPFTGGCHYSGTCDRYEITCGECPQLRSHKAKDSTYNILQNKLVQWHDLNLTIVTPSQWLANCARKSRVFSQLRIEVIPNGIDIIQYRPRDKQKVRELLNLPLNKKLILFGTQTGTSDKRKGFHHLQIALGQLRDSKDIELIILGTDNPNESSDLPLKAHYLGNLSDQLSLSLVYSAADIFAAPSEQDNLPNTVLEAMASGVPCVAFNIGGLPDMISHQQNGYLAVPFDTNDFADGIQWLLNDGHSSQISHAARQTIEQNFEQSQIARRFEILYREILQSKN